MKAVVLAAGEGTRLRPRTTDRPKPLVEVNGKPILTYCFETLLDLGIEDVVAVVGYEKDKIIDHYDDSFQALDIQYAHQLERLGLAHAVLTAEPYVTSDFVVLNGDNIYYIERFETGTSNRDLGTAHDQGLTNNRYTLTAGVTGPHELTRFYGASTVTNNSGFTHYLTSHIGKQVPQDLTTLSGQAEIEILHDGTDGASSVPYGPAVWTPTKRAVPETGCR
jgi:GTP:adenosylcobinamide-phosphate guanylyltransferase